jgi:hypothetical protein
MIDKNTARETLRLYKEVYDSLGDIPEDVLNAFRKEGLDINALPTRVRKPFLVLVAFVRDTRHDEKLIPWLYLTTFLMSSIYEEEL